MELNLGLLSISDDDLCSTCMHLQYNPGGLSRCTLGWPGEFDDDGYCEDCDKYESVGEIGDNWVLWEDLLEMN